MNLHMAAMLAALLLFFSGCLVVVERTADVKWLNQDGKALRHWHLRKVGAVNTKRITTTQQPKFFITQVFADITGLKGVNGDIATNLHAMTY